MTGAILIKFTGEGPPAVSYLADSDEEVTLLQEWLEKNLSGARPPGPCGGALTTPGAPFLLGGRSGRMDKATSEANRKRMASKS